MQTYLRSKRVPHAFLFSGPRGTGKTTTARILAKALNCERGISPEPCNECQQCKLATEGKHVDIIEIDAASNRGIDEIRNLRERIRFSPSMGRYKVYIVDEVHMLTLEAFNALLKTLEEPPTHAVFVLATTEPHKVPPTILSRCQRFEFRKLPAQKITRYLAEIARKEGVEISKEALTLIAYRADGAMRDALSILEQVVAFGDRNVDLRVVKAVLGVTDDRKLVALAKAYSERSLKMLFNVLEKLVEAGEDVLMVLCDLRELMQGALKEKVLGIKTGVFSHLHRYVDMDPQDLALVIDHLTTVERKSGDTNPLLAWEIEAVKFMTAPQQPQQAPQTQVPEERKPQVAPIQAQHRTIPKYSPEELWSKFMETISRYIRQRKLSPATKIYLSNARPVSLENGVLKVVYPPEQRFAVDFFSKDERWLKGFSKILSEIAGEEITIEFSVEENPAAPQNTGLTIDDLKKRFDVIKVEDLKGTSPE